MYRYIFAALAVDSSQHLHVGTCFALSSIQAKHEAELIVARLYTGQVDIYVAVLYDEEYHQCV